MGIIGAAALCGGRARGGRALALRGWGRLCARGWREGGGRVDELADVHGGRVLGMCAGVEDVMRVGWSCVVSVAGGNVDARMTMLVCRCSIADSCQASTVVCHAHGKYGRWSLWCFVPFAGVCKLQRRRKSKRPVR